MAEIINFRRTKKAKARAEAAKQAEANRAKFGVPKTERDLRRAQTDLDDKRFAGAKIDVKPDGD